MLENGLILNKLSSLKEERTKMVKRVRQLEEIISSTGVSKQAAWKQQAGLIDKIDERTLLVREQSAQEVTELRDKIISINLEITKLSELNSSDNNRKLLEVFKEIFTQKQLAEIRAEAERRMKGESGFRLSFSVKDSVEVAERAAKYKKIATEQMDKMIAFRLKLTQLIEKGCHQFGDGEFMKFISPLNTLILPLQELHKIKLKNNL